MNDLLSRHVLEFIMFFYIYAFLGWVVEVAFHALKCGKFINRGMLAGAVCPIYGFGAVIIIYLLDPLKSNIFILFIGSAIVCTVLEYLVGLGLDKLFHKRWWDYSDVPFNIGGYVCLQFSVYWGIGGILLIRDVQGLIQGFVNIFSTKMILILCSVFTITLIIDVLATISAINKLNKRLDLLGEVQAQIHNMSDFIGEGVTEKTLEIAEKSKPVIENLEQKKKEADKKAAAAKEEKIQDITRKLAIKEMKFENLKVDRMNRLYKKISGNSEFVDENKKYSIEDLEEKKNGLHRNMGGLEKRLVKAFPNMKEKKRAEEFNEMKEKLKRNGKSA